MSRSFLLLPAVFVATVLAVGSGTAAAAHGPLTVLGGSSSGGYPLAGSGPSGVNVRFIDRGRFWVAVLVRNRSRRPITLLGARTPEPEKSLVEETGAGFSRFTPCSGDRMCPWPSTPTSRQPLTVSPGAYAAVKLSYHLVSCAQATRSTTATASVLLLSYRPAAGGALVETTPLSGARLHLQPPAGTECLPRPYSHIGLVGSFTTSPGHEPIPGSSGDTCTETGTGGLVFRSREFLDRSGVIFRIEITLPHERGIGSYHRGGGSLGAAEITASGGFGLHGWTTFQDPSGTVSLTTTTGHTLGGRFSAVFSGHRRFFRAYGAWRCTTAR